MPGGAEEPKGAWRRGCGRMALGGRVEQGKGWWRWVARGRVEWGQEAGRGVRMALGFDWQFPGVGVSGWGGVGLRAFLGKGDVAGFVLPGQEKSVVMGFQDGWQIGRS